jgi:mannose-6-phosphate isomerase-like protein (cupin superfamily)
VREDEVWFVQTVGGRAGFPAPRRVKGRPFMRVHSATAWTTLALTIRADGTSEHELIGASAFPRHFVYDSEGNLDQKAGTVDFKTWYREAHGEHTPWGAEDSEPFVAQAESALERQLSANIMKGSGKMPRRKLKPDENLVEQGEPGDELYLVLDGVLAAVVDGEEIAQVGPGAILGEGAIVSEGTRGATLRARTAARVAVIEPEMIDRQAMETLAAGRRRN